MGITRPRVMVHTHSGGVVVRTAGQQILKCGTVKNRVLRSFTTPRAQVNPSGCAVPVCILCSLLPKQLLLRHICTWQMSLSAALLSQLEVVGQVQLKLWQLL